MCAASADGGGPRSATVADALRASAIRVHVYNIRQPDQAAIASLAGATLSFFSKLSFSPDGRFVACGSARGRAVLWAVRHRASELGVLPAS